MSDKSDATKNLRDYILEMRDEGKIVVTTLEGHGSMDIDSFLDNQPVEGVLYDLNRLGEVALTHMDDPKWVNDFAVALVIEKLFADRLALRTENAGLRRSGKIMGDQHLNDQGALINATSRCASLEQENADMQTRIEKLVEFPSFVLSLGKWDGDLALFHLQEMARDALPNSTSEEKASVD